MTTEANGLEVPCTASESYRKELNRQRILAGLSFGQLAAIVKYSKPHVYGVEMGTRPPLPPISEKFDAAFGTGVLFQGMYAGILRERPLKRFDHCLALEAKAVRIQAYGATLVPGLLQTEAYMRALFLRDHPKAAPGEVDRFIAKRLSRQEILHGDTRPEYWAILDEAVLRRAVGGPAVMREQLAALLALVDTPRTTIQVIPFDVGEYEGMNGTLILLTLPDNSVTVYQEASGIGESFDDRGTVQRRLRDYDRMKARALSPEASAAMIEAAMETFTPCEPPQT
ncbi:DUF5753 domain-containing protein [Streptomyces acidiscabies]|uniref:DUF5753 domain-containing protein n=1 Tax=Streptomyces acidiscabies TaxID=42234 RepID=A0AAP6EEB3_9ACTN|nr:DUF5753 domain-containing protein [Streptomyces acidiscabies]MBP5939520.1 helix-turn-helix domain-containing protein [Streptomyces sp. LBUM 1476]MBZ3910672.1 helix-turn-helix domain-containing protein [Streptomyces acidiscabies]MDX2959673.1 DUF5753 domain-containing protein [Streptomyces acidiscabies]MDX3019039.1 DUF5753 domain-containing protein [Streptomyces acidiscabies]MDX3790880.1 DUF5753 domain-containing protein [Streptomyces acidiscabies]